jgi:hypothetical protein
MSLMTIDAQDVLALMAAAASENVQLARASRFAGAAYASAPALRSKEVICMATMMLRTEMKLKEWTGAMDETYKKLMV